MAWLIVITCVVLVVMLLKWLGKSASPAGFAREIAKTQLVCLLAAQNSSPKASPEELFEEVIALRPGYSKQDAKELIEASRTAKVAKFRDVVLRLVVEDYRRRIGQIPNSEMVADFIHAIREVIPEEAGSGKRHK